MSDDSLATLLLKAQQADKAAADQLMNYANQNFPELIKALVVEIADPQKPIQVRQMASLFFKNQLNGASGPRQIAYFERWNTVDAGIKNYVKETLLQALITSQDPIAAKFISIACSEIAAFDLSRGEWNVYVKTLADAIDQANEAVQTASLEGFGNTFDRMDEVRTHLSEQIPELPPKAVDDMLSAIIKGVDRNIEQKRAALNALNKSLGMARHNFERKEERDFIIQAFQNATNCAEDHEVRRLGFCCFDNTAFMYYEHLVDYMKNIFDLTLRAIQHDTSEEVKVQAVEFWVTVAGVETNLLADPREASSCRGFVESAKEAIVPLLLASLTTHKDETDEDEYDFRHAGAVCLEAFAETIRASIIPTVVPFVEQNIGNTDWRFKDAAIVAFMSILTGNSTAALYNYVRGIVPLLATSTQDANEIVRDSSLHCLANILKLHVDAISPDHFEPVITTLVARLNDTPKVASSACTALFALFSYFKRRCSRENSNALSDKIKNIADLLLKALDREDGGENNLRLAIAGTLAELVDAAAMDVWPILRELIPHILQRIEQVFQAPTNSMEEKEQKDILLATFTGVVISLFQKLGKDDVTVHVERVLIIMKNLLMVDNLNSHIEAWMLVAAVANTIEDDFSRYLTEFMPLLLKTLADSRGNTDMCIQAVTTVADIAGAVSEQIQPYCDNIVSALSACLADDSLEKSCKPIAISCFGDIAFAIGGAFSPYLQSTTFVLLQASQATAHVDEGDVEQIMFFNELRGSILEAYIGIVYAFADLPSTDELAIMIVNILQFLEFLASPTSHCDIKVLTKSVSLLGDIGKNFANLEAVRHQIQVGWAAKLIQDARATQEKDAVDGANWTQGVLEQMFAPRK